MDHPLAFVVEDDATVAEAYAEVLRQGGFEVEVLRSGKAAQQRLAQAVPLVVVLDLNLPGVSGDVLLAGIRADPRLAETRVIVSTGEPQRARALDVQPDLVLQKPVSVSQLSALANRLRSGTGQLPGPGGSAGGPAE
jgi:chemosensory pili system protein ChpA (sensor histidine kinase/response regulator)